MVEQISWEIGGQQGEGVESVGELAAAVLNRQGYFLYGYRTFSSRIKGGHTHYLIRAGIRPVNAVADELDFLVALDQETINLNWRDLSSSGIILADKEFSPLPPAGCDRMLVNFPFSEIASGLGNVLARNMVALGAAAFLWGTQPEAFDQELAKMFAGKGAEAIAINQKAIRHGFEACSLATTLPIDRFRLAAADGQSRLYMMGNEAVALGAIAAGCRFMAAYPITPASEIMEYLIKKLPLLGGTVIQTEDEIAACAMAIGANYAGARAFTASSGPGISLMAESLGLAAMTETPLVVVNSQRGGPSTGLPTKHEQADLMSAIYSAHGEVTRIVMAPDSVEAAFYDTAEAFNLADEYQCPVILLADLQLSLGQETVEPLRLDRVEIRRGTIAKPEEQTAAASHEYFKRYQLTENGLSPRTLPGMGGGVHHVTGLEHDETGRPADSPIMHKAQMDKRLRKLETLPRVFSEPIRIHAPHQIPDLQVIGFGGTSGTIREAIAVLEAAGTKVNHYHIRLLNPFPAEQLRQVVNADSKVVILENNASGQLAGLIRMNVGCDIKTQSILKYDGNPFQPAEIVKACQEVLSSG